MTRKLLTAVFLLALATRAQSPSTVAPGVPIALPGSWVGTLEYRDYSEPPTSTKRVKLPTWLTIDLAGPDLRFHYIYDDGPAKTVDETTLVHIDAAQATYVETGSDGTHETYSIEGLAQLRDGRGTLRLTGQGTENKAPVSVRMTLRIGRNIFESTRETAEAGKPFTFRHAYSFVRAAPPVSNAGSGAARK